MGSEAEQDVLHCAKIIWLSHADLLNESLKIIHEYIYIYILFELFHNFWFNIYTICVYS